MKRRRALIFLVVLASVIAAALFFYQLHEIRGQSMWPAYRDGDWLLVDRRGEPVRRWDVVVVEAPGSDRTVLKRAVGFGGETLYIEGGDLLVDGSIPERSLELMRSMEVPWLRLSDLKVKNNQILGRTSQVAMRPITGSISLSNVENFLRLSAEENGQGQLRVPGDGSITDDHPGPQGRWQAGRSPVKDIAVTFRLYELSVEARLQIEQHCLGGCIAKLVITRRADGFEFALEENGAETLTQEWAGPLETTFRFVLVDGRRALEEVDSAGTITTRLEGKRRHLFGVDESHLEITLSGSRATFARLDIARDVHYTSTQTDASHGVAKPFRIPEGQIFTLGDNSAESRDSRHWGGVGLEEKWVGRPALRLWTR